MRVNDLPPDRFHPTVGSSLLMPRPICQKRLHAFPSLSNGDYTALPTLAAELVAIRHSLRLAYRAGVSLVI
jgi:hypothetical protein